jgi:hypothetical protein
MYVYNLPVDENAFHLDDNGFGIDCGVDDRQGYLHYGKVNYDK